MSAQLLWLELFRAQWVPVQLALQLAALQLALSPVHFSLSPLPTWQELSSDENGQTPAELATTANPARSRTRANIGYLFAMYPRSFPTLTLRSGRGP